MSEFLREVAEKFNRQHDEAAKAELGRRRECERQERMQSYYAEFGGTWFEELSSEIEKLIVEFNSITHDHSKLRRIESETPDSNTIMIAFLQNTQDPRDTRHVCSAGKH